MATISISRIWNIISVNLLNNLQGGKKPKRKLSKKEKKILNNYEAMFGIKEDTILHGGRVVLKKASLDEYDTQGDEDNLDDINFGLHNYDKED